MKTLLGRTAALVTCLGLLFTESASAQRQREYQMVSDAAARASASHVSYDSFETADYETADYGQADYEQADSEGCNTCGFTTGGQGNGFGLAAGFLERPGQFFFGAEYIYARASFSEALAYVVTDANNPQGGNEFVEYDFDYSSSYRFYGGYRIPDCGCEIVFEYARYESDATAHIDPTVSQTVVGAYEINGRQQNYADVDIDSYGVGIARTIPLGGCGDACGAGCGWCPLWDITWSAGLRFAEVGWGRNQIAIGGTPTAPFIDSTATTQLRFDGVGARIGLLGRRYIGRKGLASIYAKGDFSLLVGNMSISTITQDVVNVDPPVFSHRNSARRVIPVTEIEAGVSAHLGDHVTLSAGYFISAWHDLGMRDTYEFDLFQLSHYDDANILGFDGYFARAEVAF